MRLLSKAVPLILQALEGARANSYPIELTLVVRVGGEREREGGLHNKVVGQ